jgi:hypothetical protein
MNKKYELLENDTKEFLGYKLYRIRALVSIGSLVAAGDPGGYIEKEANLSTTDDAWVYGDARVFGDAWISDNARVFGNARVSGNARVYGNAKIHKGTIRASSGAQVEPKIEYQW